LKQKKGRIPQILNNPTWAKRRAGNKTRDEG